MLAFVILGDKAYIGEYYLTGSRQSSFLRRLAYRRIFFASILVRLHSIAMKEQPNFSAGEIDALKGAGGMLSRVPPDDIKKSLELKGLIEQKLGGLARTRKGDAWLRDHG
ncbi:MAG: hypothetical protein AAF713_12395 [Pseudomonadota bacterium]